MKSNYLTILGLVFDIAGAFFLSAEAIKIENLHKFREWFSTSTHDVLHPPKIISFGDRAVTQASRKYLWFYNALHYLAGTLVIFFVNKLLQNKLFQWGVLLAQWLFSQQWYWIILGVLLFLFWGLYLGLWGLGELVHEFSRAFIRIAIRVIEFIEAETSSGTVGIVGFVLLVVGFLFQMAAVWSQ